MFTTNLLQVTLLITHYNRSKSLERLLNKVNELGMTFGEVIVSDDNSRAEHLQAIINLQKTHNFRLITTSINRGLGNNLNKGQDAVSTHYTLYVQEDFIPTREFPSRFNEALAIMNNAPEIDIARFYAYYTYPYLKSFTKDFSIPIYSPLFLNTSKIYQYSDHPHLRRSNFFDKFGRYIENIKSDKTEYLMCVSFIQQGGKALFYNKFDELFIQENSPTEPSTVIRASWKQSNNIFIMIFRNIYRFFKYGYDIHLNRVLKQ